MIGDDTALGATTGALTLNGGTLKANNYLDLGTRSIVLGSAGGTIDDDTWGVTIGGVISGNGSLTTNGTFAIYLTGTNTYSGTTTVNGGTTLQIGMHGTSGTLGTGAVTINFGNRLLFSRSDSITVSNAISGGGDLIVNDGTTILTGSNSYAKTTVELGDTLQVGNGGTTGTLGTGPVNLYGILRLNRSDTMIVSNVIQDGANVFAGTLIQAGSGTGILTGTNSYSGGTTITAGTLQIGNGGTNGSLGSGDVTNNTSLVFDRRDTITVANAISGTGTLTQAGSGVLDITGINTYSGGTTISNGTLEVEGAGTLGTGPVTDNAELLFNFGSTTVVANAISGTGHVTFKGSGGTILTGNSTYTGGTTLDNAAILIGGNGSAGGATGSVIGDIALGLNGSSGTLAFNRSNAYSYTGNISGQGEVDHDGPGTLTLTGTNTYSGRTYILQGVLEVYGDVNLGTGPIGVGGGTLRFLSSTNSALHYDVIGNDTQGAFDTNGFDVTLSGTVTTPNNVNVAGGFGGFIKLGLGKLTLTGNDTYLGSTYIQAGTLQIGNGGTTGSLGAGSVTDNAAMVFDRSDNIAVANAISGTGTLTQAGSGILTLAGAGTYTGQTFINAGTLALSGSGSIMPSSSVIDNAVLDISQAGSGASVKSLGGSGTIALGGNKLIIYSGTGRLSNGAFSGAITDGGIAGGTGGSLEFGTGGIQALTGANTYTGTTTIDSGSYLYVGLNTATGSLGSGAVINNGFLEYERSTAATVANQISGTGELYQLGSGTLTLTAAESYTGRTVIGAGATLALSGAGSIAASSHVDPAGGTFDISGTTAGASILTLSDLQTAGGVVALGNKTLTITAGVGNIFSGTIQDGGIAGGTGGGLTLASGYQALTGNNSYTGTTTIANGATLLIGNNTASGSLGSGTVVNNGTLEFLRSDTATIANAISGTGSFQQYGTGHAILTGVNSYTGATTVFGGTLSVDGSITASSAIAVANLGALGGTGTVGTINIGSGGILAPGDGIGTLHVNGSLTMASSATFAEEILPGAADAVMVSGAAGIGGTLTENFAGGSYGHQTFTLLHASGGISGTFSNIAVTGLPAGLDATVTYDAQNVYLTTDHAPVVTTSNLAELHGQTLAASSLFSLSDADSESATRYQLWDATTDPGSGYFVLGGVAQTARTVIDISAAQLSQVSFVTGTAGDSLQIRAYDGTDWSADANAKWSPFNISIAADNPPVVTTSNINAQRGQALAASSLFTVSDADGDAITRYQLWDGNTDPASGHFVMGGVAQAARTVIDISAAQLSQVSFVAGSAASDTLQIRAYDGIAWSAGDNAQWSPFTVTVPINHAPVVTTSDVNTQRNQTLAASSLFSVSDADNDTITRYELWDANTDPASGYFVVGGVIQAARTVIDISAAQLAQVSFVTGKTGDALQIRAFDGTDWSAADNARWSPFNVIVPPNNAPVVTTSDVAAQHDQILALSSLFTASDADNDTITKYQIWDSTTVPDSGHFVVGGAAQPSRTVIEITPSQLAQTSFVTGGVGASLQIRAFDGSDWSAADNARWSPFNVTVPPNNAPVVTTADVTTTAGQSLTASSLFTASDADGDAITEYQFWDSTADPASGHFVVGGVAQAARTVIDLPASQLGQISFLTGSVGDMLQVRAFDGRSWSAADSAQWAPFHIIS